MLTRGRTTLGLLLVVLFGGSALAQIGNVAEARRLAQSGRRSDALALLGAHLILASTDTDARTLRGTVLSWEGRYDEARADLEQVLAGVPVHADALQALARIELWDGHPDRSEAWAARGLAAHPDDVINLMELRALALEALKRTREGLAQINATLRREPRRDTALRIRRRLINRQPTWLSGASFRWDRFDDRRDPWQETQLSLARQSAFGSIGVRAYGARRFGQTDGQVEIEAYPQVRRGTYAYVAAHGRYHDDIPRPDVERLRSETVTAEINRRAGRSYLSAFVTVRREDRTTAVFVWQTTAGVATRVRF